MIMIEDLCLYKEILGTLSANKIEPELQSLGKGWGVFAVSELPDELNQQFSEKGATVQQDEKFDME